MPPARQVAVLTCMDARLHPERFLGLDIGDAHVIRNAGGRASDDAVRSLIISSKLLGTREFVVIHHTDCGMLTFTSQELQERLTEETGADASVTRRSLLFHGQSLPHRRAGCPGSRTRERRGR